MTVSQFNELSIRERCEWGKEQVVAAGSFLARANEIFFQDKVIHMIFPVNNRKIYVKAFRLPEKSKEAIYKKLGDLPCINFIWDGSQPYKNIVFQAMQEQQKQTN